MTLNLTVCLEVLKSFKGGLLVTSVIMAKDLLDHLLELIALANIQIMSAILDLFATK